MGHMIYNNFVREASQLPGAHQPPRPTNLKDFEAALLSSPKGTKFPNTRNNPHGLFMNEASSGPQFCSTLTGMDANQTLGSQTLLYSAVFGDPRYSAEKASEDPALITSRTYKDSGNAGQDPAAFINRSDTLERSGIVKYQEAGELSPLITERDGLVQIIGDDNGANIKTVCNINTVDS